MSSGTHTLELATFIVDGTTLLESERTSALRVIVAGALTTGSSTGRSTGDRVVTADGVVLRVDLVRADLNEAADLAFAPDGRLFVAESAGAIRVAVHPSDPTVATPIRARLSGR